MSCKNNQKHLVGQPVFKQILDIIPRSKFDMLARKHQSDRYYMHIPEVIVPLLPVI
ncbi:MAG: DUF4372 domain-containing protein [Bacteroidia bacterium]